MTLWQLLQRLKTWRRGSRLPDEVTVVEVAAASGNCYHEEPVVNSMRGRSTPPVDLQKHSRSAVSTVAICVSVLISAAQAGRYLTP